MEKYSSFERVAPWLQAEVEQLLTRRHERISLPEAPRAIASDLAVYGTAVSSSDGTRGMGEESKWVLATQVQDNRDLHSKLVFAVDEQCHLMTRKECLTHVHIEMGTCKADWTIRRCTRSISSYGPPRQ